MPGNWGLIDLETPQEAYALPSWNDPSITLQLVFSDEFNTPGRSFYPGDDPYWEAVDLHYWVSCSIVSRRTSYSEVHTCQETNNLEWYSPEAITTANGSLIITLSEKNTHNLNFQGGTLILCFFCSRNWSVACSGLVSSWSVSSPIVPLLVKYSSSS